MKPLSSGLHKQPRYKEWLKEGDLIYYKAKIVLIKQKYNTSPFWFKSNQ